MYNNIINPEDAAIGCMILEKAGQDVGFLLLKPEYLTHPLNIKIFEVMLEMKQERKAIDLVTLCAACKPYKDLFASNHQHYAQYVATLATQIHLSINVTTYCQLTIEAYVEKEIEELPKRLKDPKKILDAFEQLELLKEQIKHIDKVFIDNGVVCGIEAYENACLNLFEKNSQHLHWGLGAINRQINGINKGDLIIVAGRPGMGKTDFALYILQTICRQQKHCLIFSIEMTAEALYKRIMQFILKLDSKQLTEIKMSDYEKALVIFKRDFEPYLNIVETGTVNNSLVEAKTAEFKQRHGDKFGAVIVDYLQIMAGDGNGETERVTKISNNLKRTAKDNLVPIIALSQLSREVEKRADKRPMLSDLRQTGAIEQDADVVLFLYREDYYFKDQAGYTKNYELEVIAAKVREGETGSMKVHYNPANKIIADSAPLETKAITFSTNFNTGEVFKTQNGQTAIDDFNSTDPAPF
jgi:replicative DNA helicase